MCFAPDSLRLSEVAASGAFLRGAAVLRATCVQIINMRSKHEMSRNVEKSQLLLSVRILQYPVADKAEWAGTTCSLMVAFCGAGGLATLAAFGEAVRLERCRLPAHAGHFVIRTAAVAEIPLRFDSFQLRCLCDCDITWSIRQQQAHLATAGQGQNG
jgi:hypothetical protein